MPDLSRLSIRKGFVRMFGPRGWTEFLKSLLKLGAVAVVVGLDSAAAQRYALVSAMFVDAGDLPLRLLSLCAKTITSVTARRSLVIAGADLAWARIHWRRDQRMSKQEIKEEVKQSEGDRVMKARLRSLRLDRSRRRMLTAVPRATMVVVNPTHYAVALRYVRSEGGAPMVLAKGVDLIALKNSRNRRGELYSDHRGQAARAFAVRRGQHRQRHSARILSRGRRTRSSHPGKEKFWPITRRSTN